MALTAWTEGPDRKLLYLALTSPFVAQWKLRGKAHGGSYFELRWWELREVAQETEHQMPGASLPSLLSIPFYVGLATCTLVECLGLGAWDLGIYSERQGKGNLGGSVG